MATITGMTVESICKDALPRVLGGDTPHQMAAEIVGELWDEMDDELKVKLCVGGLAAAITSAVYSDRVGANKGDGLNRDEVDKLHDEIQCPFDSHQQYYSKRCQCVGYIIRMSGANRKKEVKKRLDDNVSYFKRYDERNEKIRQLNNSMTEMISIHRAKAILEGIVLHCAGNSMRPLLSFSKSDLEMWKLKSRRQMRAWADRLAWFSDVEKEMEGNKVDFVRDLPMDVLINVATRAMSIWSKGGSSD